MRSGKYFECPLLWEWISVYTYNLRKVIFILSVCYQIGFCQKSKYMHFITVFHMNYLRGPWTYWKVTTLLINRNKFWLWSKLCVSNGCLLPNEHFEICPCGLPKGSVLGLCFFWSTSGHDKLIFCLANNYENSYTCFIYLENIDAHTFFSQKYKPYAVNLRSLQSEKFLVWC